MVMSNKQLLSMTKLTQKSCLTILGCVKPFLCMLGVMLVTRMGIRPQVKWDAILVVADSHLNLPLGGKVCMGLHCHIIRVHSLCIISIL